MNPAIFSAIGGGAIVVLNDIAMVANKKSCLHFKTFGTNNNEMNYKIKKLVTLEMVFLAKVTTATQE